MPTPKPSPEQSDEFYGAALTRIRKFMLWASALGLAFVAVSYRWPATLGYTIGAAISYLNHRWLERTAEALGERITSADSHERGGVIVFRAVLRYLLIVIGAYVIFNVSLTALYGFLGGICLPVLGLICEAVVEASIALRRGT